MHLTLHFFADFSLFVQFLILHFFFLPLTLSSRLSQFFDGHLGEASHVFLQVLLVCLHAFWHAALFGSFLHGFLHLLKVSSHWSLQFSNSAGLWHGSGGGEGLGGGGDGDGGEGLGGGGEGLGGGGEGDGGEGLGGGGDGDGGGGEGLDNGDDGDGGGWDDDAATTTHHPRQGELLTQPEADVKSIEIRESVTWPVPRASSCTLLYATPDGRVR